VSRVVHFEFATPEPEREIEFFTSVFGWKIERWGEEPYWLIDTGEGDSGINGAIAPLQAADQPRVMNWVGVGDIDAAVEKALAAGATLAMEKQEAPGVGWMVVLQSPTGILFGIIQPMPGSMP